MLEIPSEEGTIAGYNKKTVVMVLIAAVLLGGAFYAGAKYEKNKLSRLGLLSGGKNQAQTADTKNGTKKGKATPVVVQKFVDQDYAKTAYLISGTTLSADAKKALTGFVMSKKALADGTTEILLKAQKPEYHDQTYVLKAGELLYFVEKSLVDDANGVENNVADDSAVVVDAAGNVVQVPGDWSK